MRHRIPTDSAVETIDGAELRERLILAGVLKPGPGERLTRVTIPHDRPSLTLDEHGRRAAAERLERPEFEARNIIAEEG